LIWRNKLLQAKDELTPQRIPASQVGQGARYGPSSSFATRTSVASSSVNLRGSDRSPPAPSASDTNFYPGDPNDWSKEDDDYLHNFDPKDKRVSISVCLKVEVRVLMYRAVVPFSLHEE